MNRPPCLRVSVVLSVLLNCLCWIFSGARAEESAPEPAPPDVFNKPHLAIGGGSVRYRETDFNSAPSLHSNFEEPAVMTDAGWDFIFSGHHTLRLDFAFVGTATGTEDWHESGSLIQENDLHIHRFGISIGYLASTWNRAAPPELLAGVSRYFRFSGGVDAFYRRQAFFRTDFVDFTQTPPASVDVSSEEDFDMGGGEVVLELEAGPRNIAAFFLDGRAGAEYVSVVNDAIPFASTQDTRINTHGVHGAIEAGVVSQPLRSLELRLGYRYDRLDVFGDSKVIQTPQATIGLELPDNVTEMHLIFLEAAFLF
jgi:hypothetical protein